MNKVNFRKFFALLLTMIMMFAVFAPNTFALIGIETKPVVNTFTPEEIEVSDLIIKKKVEHPFDALYNIPNHIAFEFEVDFGKFYAGFNFNTSAGEIEADENGKIRIAVRPNYDFGIEGVDEGTVVTITELQKDGDGFTPKDGVVTKQVTIQSDSPAVAEFVNIYKPERADGSGISLFVSKDLQGRKWQKGDRFTFRLEYNNGSGWKEMGTKSIEFNHQGTNTQLDFTKFVDGLRFSSAGTYSFRLTEVVGDLEYVAYDTTVNEFDVIVHDPDMDGKLQIVSIKGKKNVSVTLNEQDNTYRVDVPFTNIYTEPTPIIPDDIVVPLNIQKKIKSKAPNPIGPDGFEFVLESVDTGATLTRVTNEKGVAQYKLGFSAEDIDKTYRFKLREVNTKKAGVTYDKTEYDISITIVCINDVLKPIVISNGESNSSNLYTFTNIYRPNIGESPDTGDHTNLDLYLMLAAISAALIALLLVFRKKLQYFMN